MNKTAKTLGKMLKDNGIEHFTIDFVESAPFDGGAAYTIKMFLHPGQVIDDKDNNELRTRLISQDIVAERQKEKLVFLEEKVRHLEAIMEINAKLSDVQDRESWPQLRDEW